MSRWKRHSDDGSRGPRALPSCVIATMSTGCIDSYAIPVGVTRKLSSNRALTLPDLPRFKPRAFMSIAVAMIFLRKASSSMDSLRKQPRQSRFRRRAYTTLRNQTCQKAAGRHVERGIGHDGAGGCDRLSAGVEHLAGIALLDRHVVAGGQRPIDRRRRHRRVHWHVVIARCQRFLIRSDLVAYVAVASHAIGADEHEIDAALTHQRGAGRIDDERVRYAMSTQLPCSQLRTLQPRPRLADPDVQRDARGVGQIDRSRRRAPTERRQRAGVAMREYLHRRLTCAGERLDDLHAVLAESAVGRDVLGGDRAR